MDGREDPTRAPWRVGRRVGRTIYQQLWAQPTDGDLLIGVMDTPELAQEAVWCHNDRLRPARASDPPIARAGS